MATRSIVTSQPDVACDVCERRLLRGEQPEVFLAAGRRRTVCELCAPRAAHEGWLRETDRHSVSLPPLRPRRGRNLFDRLRQAARPGAPTELPADELPYEREQEPYDFLDSYAGVAEEPSGTLLLDGGEIGQTPASTEDRLPFAAAAAGTIAPDRDLTRAIESFNAGEYPRRVAGVARSLGVPEVNVRTAEHAAAVVRIVVAWELCWYRYEVDLDEQPAEARVIAQGTELDELTREDRLANAVADERGALSLSGA